MNIDELVLPTPDYDLDEQESRRTDPDYWRPFEVYRNVALKESVVRRESWGAKPPSYQDPKQDGLVEHIVLTYTHTAPCGDTQQCEGTMRDMQESYMSNGQADIPYSFIIGGDDRIYSGRGWTTSAPVPDGYALNPLRTLVIARVGQPTCGLKAYNRDFHQAFKLISFCYEEHLGTRDIDLKAIYHNWNQYPSPAPPIAPPQRPLTKGPPHDPDIRIFSFPEQNPTNYLQPSLEMPLPCNCPDPHI